ncbi:transporter [Glacieibacterium sp.]|uniref:transporter n=1 Tax=Glacieibacterium sp. TaxID=2860237 RepID=UPI003B005291
MKLLVLAALLLATPALADDLRDLCPDRPGQGTPPCIVDKGHVLIEFGVGAFEHDKQPDSITNSFTGGDVTARLGLTDRLEVLAEWSAYNRVHERDRATGATTTDHGVGDVLLGFKYSLANPDGKGVSVAVQPFVTAPTAKSAIGAGGWTQGIEVPVSIDLTDDLQLGLTPIIERLPDTLGSGHHAAYSLVTELDRALGPTTIGVELYASRDTDPGAHETQASFDVTLAQTVGKDLQLDGEVDAGLTHDTPDVRVLVGFARRF